MERKGQGRRYWSWVSVEEDLVSDGWNSAIEVTHNASDCYYYQDYESGYFSRAQGFMMSRASTRDPNHISRTRWLELPERSFLKIRGLH